MPCLSPASRQPEGRLFRVGLAEGLSGGDAGCVACHTDARPKVGGSIAMMHTREAHHLKVEPTLPLGCTSGGEELILCNSCHNPHSGADALKTLLRVKPGEKGQQLCMHCHRETAHIESIGHGTGPLDAAGFETGACKPCHLIHTDPQAVEARYLWPKKLSCPADMPEPPRVPDRPCRACHRKGGPVAPPAVATHPKADFFNPTPLDSPGYLPLFNDQGEVDPQG